MLVLTSETEGVGTERNRELLIPPSEMEGVGEGDGGKGAARTEQKYMSMYVEGKYVLN